MRPAILLLFSACIGCDLNETPHEPTFFFSAYPRGTTVGAVLTPTPQVRILDWTGYLDSNATDLITISLSGNPGGGTLSGATTVAAANGVATFPNLSIDKQGEGYVLTAAPRVLPASRFPALGGAFNVACACWSSKAPMPTGRPSLGVGVANGVLYAIGGYSQTSLATVEAYDPVANTWTTKAPMPTSRFALAVGVVNGVVYAIGGFNYSSGLILPSVAYDPVANSWTTKAPMPTPRSGLAVGVVNGVLYAVGGDSGSAERPVGTTEAYDPSTNSWTTKPSMPTPRSGLAVGVVNGVLYAVGGTDGNYYPSVYGPPLTTVEAYDPVTNSWTTKAPMPTPRYGLAVGVVSGFLYAVGGSGPTGTVAVYDPAANSWTSRGPMLTSRTSLGAGVVNGVLYAVGGLPLYNGAALATLEAYDPAQDR